ncbi:MAG: SBBP repeat-containing protein [Polyangiales bacterium]
MFSTACADNGVGVYRGGADVVFADLPAASRDAGTSAADAGDVVDVVVTDIARVDAVDVAALDAADVADVATTSPADVVAPRGDVPGPTSWARRIGEMGADVADDIALDALGNVYVTGRFGSPTPGLSNDDMFLASFGPDGSTRWMRRFGGAANDSGRGVAVDRNGNVYLTGYFGESVDFGGGALVSAGGLDLVVASFTTDGVHRWSRRAGGRYGDNGQGIATDADGNVFLTAVITDAADLGGGELRPPRSASPGLVVASFTSGGVHRWSRVVGGLYSNVTARLATAPDGDVVLAGSFNYGIDLGGGMQAAHAGTDGFVARLGPDGAYRWSQNYGGNMTIAFVAPERVAVDGEGNIVTTGTLNATVDFGPVSSRVTGQFDAFLLSLRADGQHRWSAMYPGVDTDRALGLAVDFSGNILITGFLSRGVNFGGVALQSAGSYDIFVASFAAGGAHRWSRRFGSAQYEESRAIAVDEFGGVFVSGTFRAPLDFGVGALTPTGSDDGFLVRFMPP